MGRSSALKLLKRAMDFQCIKEVSGTLCADVIESKTANKAENKASTAVDAFARKQAHVGIATHLSAVCCINLERVGKVAPSLSIQFIEPA